MAEAPRYLRVTRTAAVNGVFTAVWVAAGELPTGKRRLVRTASTAIAIAVGWAALPPQERPFTWNRDNGFAMAKVAEPAAEKHAEDEARETRPEIEMSPGRRIALASAMLAFSAGVTLGGRKLEKRWLAGLQRAGHPYPYRALAWRMAMLNAAGTVSANLLEVLRAKEMR